MWLREEGWQELEEQLMFLFALRVKGMMMAMAMTDGVAAVIRQAVRSRRSHWMARTHCTVMEPLVSD